MAKKNFTPCERFLRFQYDHPGGGAEDSVYIDLARELSKVNRRFYRQGKVYRVANVSITSRDTTNGLVSFSTAPDTWVTRNSWKRGKDMYDAMNKLVLDAPGSSARKGKYHDFKVYLSDDHRTDIMLRARDNGNNQVQSGEWIYSEFRTPDGDPGSRMFTTHLLGDHVGSTGNETAVGLVQSYGEARATVHKETPLVDTEGSDDPLLNLFDDGTQVDEIAADLENDADAPPYALMSGSNEATVGEYYPGAASNMPKPIVKRLASIGQSGGSNAPTVMLPGFDAMCGLIEIEIQSAKVGIDQFDIIIELAPGSYKGVAAFDI